MSLFQSSLFPSDKSSVFSLSSQEVERGVNQGVETNCSRSGLCSGELLWPFSS